jgi:hypothetical protein
VPDDLGDQVLAVYGVNPAVLDETPVADFAAPALLTARLGSPWSRASIQARFQKKLWGINFFSLRT